MSLSPPGIGRGPRGLQKGNFFKFLDFFKWKNWSVYDKMLQEILKSENPWNKNWSLAIIFCKRKFGICGKAFFLTILRCEKKVVILIVLCLKTVKIRVKDNFKNNFWICKKDCNIYDFGLRSWEISVECEKRNVSQNHVCIMITSHLVRITSQANDVLVYIH